LGFGENTKKWLEQDYTIGTTPRGPIAQVEKNHFHKKTPTAVNTDDKIGSQPEMIEDEKFEVRYEVCRSSNKI